MKRFTLHNPQDEIRQYRKRVIILGIVITLLLSALIARLVYLQTIQHYYYLTLSRQNLLSVAPVDPGRGLIYDRNGVLLAGNMPVFSLEVFPDRVKHLKQNVAALSKLITLSSADLQDFDRQLEQHRRFASVSLKVKLTEAEIATFAVNQYRFPGFFVKAHLVRYYPFGELMTPVLGYVGRINAKELAAVDPANYSASNYIGKTGVEKYDEFLLHGTVGIQQIETSAQGNVIRTSENRPAIAGQNIYLTIDSRLQLAAKNALAGQSGAVVAIDPRNGEVLALVSTPSFDPNQFVTGISTQAYERLQKDPARPLFNLALQAEFPPGSTMKPFYAMEGLSSGIITPEKYIFDPGFFKLPGSSHIYRDWRRKGHGSVNVESAIIQSCDTFFYHLAQNMGITRLDAVLTQFGFGQPTGIDTYTEKTGLVPTPEWKESVHHQHWYPGDTVITGIGQGFLLVTPLQLANAMVRLVDNGRGYVPHLFLQSEAPGGAITPAVRQALPVIPLPKADFTLVLRALREVVSSPLGTGYHAGLGASYTFGGKSGTAQVFSLKGNQKDIAKLLPERLRDHTWFMAFAPAENPTVVIVIFVKHGGEGGATGIMRHILDSYFALQKTQKTAKSS